LIKLLKIVKIHVLSKFSSLILYCFTNQSYQWIFNFHHFSAQNEIIIYISYTKNHWAYFSHTSWIHPEYILYTILIHCQYIFNTISIQLVRIADTFSIYSLYIFNTHSIYQRYNLYQQKNPIIRHKKISRYFAFDLRCLRTLIFIQPLRMHLWQKRCFFLPMFSSSGAFDSIKRIFITSMNQPCTGNPMWLPFR